MMETTVRIGLLLTAGLLLCGAVSLVLGSWQPLLYGVAGGFTVLAAVLTVDALRK